MKGEMLVGRKEGVVDADFFPTPPEVTRSLLHFLLLPKDLTIWEPACGTGDMAETIKAEGYRVYASELNERGYGYTGVDFLRTKKTFGDYIMTNPPFSLATEFIEHCISIGLPFALVLKSQFWHAKNRLRLFEKHRPLYVLPLTWRPDYCRGKRGNRPTMETMWTVWNSKPAHQTLYIPLRKCCAVKEQALLDL